MLWCNFPLPQAITDITSSTRHLDTVEVLDLRAPTINAYSVTLWASYPRLKVII